MEKHQSRSAMFLHYISIFLASLAVYICGTALGWTSAVIPKLNGQIDAKNNPFLEPLTIQQETWLGSLLPLGATFGAIFCGLLVNKIGIRKAFMIAAISLLLSFLIILYPASFKLLYVFRILSGFGVGGIFTILSIAIGQIEDGEDKKMFCILMQFGVNLGLCLSYEVGFLERIPYFNLLCSVAPILFLVLVAILIAGSLPSCFVTSDETNDAEVKLKINLNKINQEKSDMCEIFKSSASLKALMISIGLVLIQQLSGIYVILFYINIIFRDSKISLQQNMVNSKYLTIIIGSVLIFSSFLPIIKKMRNKRLLLMFSALGMSISHGFLSYYFYVLNYRHQNNAELLFYLPIGCLAMYIISYSIGFGQLTWTFIGELFPSNVKSMGITLTISCSSLFAFITTKFFFYFGDMLGMENFFLILSIICSSGAIIINFIVPQNGKILLNNYEILPDKITLL